jgi:hypothetical protein
VFLVGLKRLKKFGLCDERKKFRAALSLVIIEARWTLEKASWTTVELCLSRVVEDDDQGVSEDKSFRSRRACKYCLLSRSEKKGKVGTSPSMNPMCPPF